MEKILARIDDRDGGVREQGRPRGRAGRVGGGEKTPSYAVRVDLLQASLRTQLVGRLHAELFGRRIAGSLGEASHGGALELAYDLFENLSLVAGYGTLAIDDPDLREVAPWSRGLYYRVQLKF